MWPFKTISLFVALCACWPGVIVCRLMLGCLSEKVLCEMDGHLLVCDYLFSLMPFWKYNDGTYEQHGNVEYTIIDDTKLVTMHNEYLGHIDRRAAERAVTAVYVQAALALAREPTLKPEKIWWAQCQVPTMWHTTSPRRRIFQ